MYNKYIPEHCNYLVTIFILVRPCFLIGSFIEADRSYVVHLYALDYQILVFMAIYNTCTTVF